MAQGWYAKDRLKPLWDTLPGKSYELADRTGILRNTLSSYNSGRLRLGMKNAKIISEALNVSIYDLGAPRPAEETFATSLLGRIVEELERNPPDGPRPHLLELVAALRGVADRLEAVAADQDDEQLPG